ncbi:MAG TPA: helix-turn-helix domain-containing protein [Terracidiphilus sp.]
MAVVVMTPAVDLPTRIERMDGAMSAPTLARLLGMGRSAVYEMASTGRIPHYRLGSTIRFDPAVVAAWLRQREVKRAA